MLTGLEIQRKNLMPAFAFRHLKELYPIFWTKSMELVEAVTHAAQTSDTSTVEVNGWASRAALDIIGVAGSEYSLPYTPGTWRSAFVVEIPFLSDHKSPQSLWMSAIIQ